jgi:hypothetical protein
VPGRLPVAAPVDGAGRAGARTAASRRPRGPPRAAPGPLTRAARRCAASRRTAWPPPPGGRADRSRPMIRQNTMSPSIVALRTAGVARAAAERGGRRRSGAGRRRSPGSPDRQSAPTVGPGHDRRTRGCRRGTAAVWGRDTGRWTSQVTVRFVSLRPRWSTGVADGHRPAVELAGHDRGGGHLGPLTIGGRPVVPERLGAVRDVAPAVLGRERPAGCGGPCASGRGPGSTPRRPAPRGPAERRPRRPRARRIA